MNEAEIKAAAAAAARVIADATPSQKRELAARIQHEAAAQSPDAAPDVRDVTAARVRNWEDANTDDTPLARRIRSAANAGVADAMTVLLPVFNAHIARIDELATRAEAAAARMEAAQVKPQSEEI
jgi:hypothetical protein